MIRILYFAVIVIALPLERLYGLDISSWWHQLSRQYKKRRELPATIRFYCLKTEQSKVQTSTALFDSTGRGNSNSPEEKLQLKVSIESTGFLKNIIEYGNNRMARRAVGVLQKMPAYRIIPQEIHYTEAIKACEKSDQYSLAIAVFEEMKARDVPRTSATYAALISVAERTDHFQEAVDIYNEMISNEYNIALSTDICNSCLWAMGKCEAMDSIIDLLQKMASQGIPRDSNTFAAALNGCDINGAADLALQLLGEMEEGNFEMNTPIYNSALWACLKGGQWQNTVDLFDIMDKKGIKKDTNSYNAVIWAYENGENSRKAVEMLRLMKFEGLARETISFDGALSALSKAGDWSLLLELLKWMKLDGLEKSYVTYRLAIDTLDKARKYSYIDEIYLESLRSGFYSPWVKKSRQLDLRGFSTALAKVAMKIVLMAIFEGKLAVFTLNITVGDVVASAAEHGETSEIISSLNVDTLIHYLEHFYLESSRPSHVFGEEDSSVPVPGPLVTHDVQEKTLTVQRVIEQSEGEGSVERLIVPREALVKWVEDEKRDFIQ